MATYNQLSDGRPDGTQLGQSASDLVGFHGTAPVAQYATVGAQSINALSVSGVIGFTSSTSFSSVIEKLNSIIDLLKDYGLMASS